MNSRAKGARAEEWRPVVGYEGLYEVSNLGRVKSLPKYNYKEARIMKPNENIRDGRQSVILCKSPKDHKRVSVHRIVALAFVSNPHGYTEVNHKDENPKNNSADNLEWCSRRYNMTYGKMPDLYKSKRRPVIASDQSGETFFESISDAVSAGFPRHRLMYALKHGNEVDGFTWRYADGKQQGKREASGA